MLLTNMDPENNKNNLVCKGLKERKDREAA